MRMKLKNSKKKIKRNIYILFLLILFLFSFFFTVKIYFNKKENSTIKYLIQNNSPYINSNNRKKILNKLISIILNIDFSDVTTLINNNYKYKEIKIELPEEDNVEKLPISNYVKDPSPNFKIDEPIVYIYNTHQSEEYNKSNNQEYSVKPTVMTASYIIRENLNKNNIPTIVEENDITEFLRTNNWNYASSYKVSRMLMENAKDKNNTLTYFVDIHRDSVKRNISTVNINDKSYAKILFIVGLENNNYKENLLLTEKLDNMFKEKYQGISRGIYKKKGKGVNGVYNQDFSNRTILIEVGGEENTIDEVNNTCEAISDILTEYIKEDYYEK